MIDMIKGLEDCGIPKSCCGELAEQMEKYIKEIILFNSAYNLTNTSDRDELVVRHIFDSLAAFPELLKVCENLNENRTDSLFSILDLRILVCTLPINSSILSAIFPLVP